MDALWADLAGNDAARAYRAVWALVAAPELSPPLLRRHLSPVPVVDDRRIAGLIADLDSDRFAVRTKAAADLEGLGGLVEPALREALPGAKSLEMRRRIEQVLERLEGGERLRVLRALAVLEHLDTPPARRALEDLAGGAPAARLTREAKASLQRLARRPAVMR